MGATPMATPDTATILVHVALTRRVPVAGAA